MRRPTAESWRMSTRVQPTTDPFPAGMQRMAALSGIAFALLLLATILFSGAESPDFKDPVQEWTAYAKDTESDLRLGVILMGLAAFEWLWFLGLLRSAVGLAETAARGFTRLSYIVLGGGIAGISGLTLGVFSQASAVEHTDADPQVIRGLSDFSGSLFELGMVGFAAMFTALGILVLRTVDFPKWLGWLALVTGVFSLLTLGVAGSEGFDNDFGIFYPLAFLGIFISSIAWSVIFLRRLRVVTEPVPPVV